MARSAMRWCGFCGSVAGAAPAMVALLVAACSAGVGPGEGGGADLSPGAVPDLALGVDAGAGDLTAAPGARLKQPSRSSAIAISDDDRIVAAVSPDDDRLYLIDTAKGNGTVAVALPAGSEPRSVAYAPDGSFWVVNRRAGTLINVRDIASPTPAVGAPITVGAEPTAVAVTPLGTRVAVANYADGTVTLVDAARGAVTRSVDVGANPRALAISSDAASDDQETIYVSRMFGQPIAGLPSEGSDVGREGQIVALPVAATVAGAVYHLGPLADTTFTVLNKATAQPVKVGAYPNQLQALALSHGRLFAPSTGASPAGPVGFAGNVHPLVSVLDLQSGKELPFGTSGEIASSPCGTAVKAQGGYAAGTLDLAVQVRDLNGGASPPPVLFPTIPVDLAFVPGIAGDIAYVVSQSSDEVVRVAWDFASNTACVGAANAKVINLQAQKGDIKVPIGVVIRHDRTLGYVNSWAGREVEVISFADQAVSARVPLSPQPQGEPEATIQKGKKLFWTSTGRWSQAGWGSCGACHPDGLSDNVTFVFATGPRNTLPLDAVYARGVDGQNPGDRRILNWSGIFDEVHDFENNTRGVSGGLGAVVSLGGVQIDLAATKDNNLNGSVKQLAADGNSPRALVGGGSDKVDVAVASGWDAIDQYLQSLRSLRHPAALDPEAADVKAGRALFDEGQCAKCHAGRKWTISTVFYQPTQGAAPGSATCSLQNLPLAKKQVPVGGNVPQNTDAVHLQTEKTATPCAVAADCAAIAGAACVAGRCSIAPQRLTCALRNVGTFGAGPQGAGFEVRSDTLASGAGLVAEGQTGFNVPSLLSLAATAPYLHNGAAPTLRALLVEPAFAAHRTAGNPNFQLADADAALLEKFLLSIDAASATAAIDPGQDLCGGAFATSQAACTNP